MNQELAEKINELKLLYLFNVANKENSYINIKQRLGGYSRKHFESIFESKQNELKEQINKLEVEQTVS